MTSNNRMSSLIVLLGAAVVSWFALRAGELFAGQYQQMSSYAGFAFIAFGFLVFMGLAVFSFLSFTELVLPQRGFSMFFICLCAGLGLICSAFTFGFGVHAFSSGSGTDIGAWDILLVVGVVPPLLAAWTLLFRRSGFKTQ